MIGTSAASRRASRRAGEGRVRVLILDGPGGRADLKGAIQWLGEQKYLSLMVEAGSKVNWSALEMGAIDKIFFYYAPKILGGLQSLPIAGGIGRRRRADAIQLRDIQSALGGAG